MRQFVVCLLLVCSIATIGVAQQSNSPFASLNINSPASPPPSIPVIVNTFTDSKVNLNVRGFPGVNPILVLFATSNFTGGSIQNGALSTFGMSIDLPDQGAAGYGDQIFLNGFKTPFNFFAYTSATGDVSIPNTIPACTIINNVVNCISQQSFEVSAQTLVIDNTQPFGVNATGAATARFTLGYQSYNLSGNNSGIFNFLGGFTFKFYGLSYTRAWISSNGYVSFTTAPTGFPSPTVNCILGGPPRIMCFYNDLEPQITLVGQRIYAQQFEQNGVRKIKFVHQRLAEFSNTTGPHGGEVVITDNDEISVLVAPYNSQPSINTGVGITPGNGVDNVSNLPTAFGRNLSTDRNTGPTTLTQGRSGFELFDHGTGPTNPLDLTGVGATDMNGVGPGIVYTLNPATPNLSPASTSYIIQPPGLPLPPPSCQ